MPKRALFVWPGWSRVLLLSFLGVVLWSLAARAGVDRKVEQDSDGDGKIDRILYVDAQGEVVKLDVDSDGDGWMDTFQCYEKGILVKAEKDRNRDGRVDERVLLENGKRSRHEEWDEKGRLVTSICFDAEERPVSMERDTTGDGRMNAWYSYEQGRLQTVALDTDGDGKPNVWQTYRNDVPVEQKSDRNGDGRIEQIVRYDGQGQPLESEHDLDGDGILECVRRYRDGVVARQEIYSDRAGSPKIVTEYVKEEPTLEKRDTNGDGSYDVQVRFDRGVPAKMEEDTNHDGRLDRWTVFDAAGQPAEIREDTRHAGRIDRIRRFREGKPVQEEVQGPNRSRSVTDFRDGQPVARKIDANGDGRFETVQRFDDPRWTMVAETDENGDGRPEARHCFQGEVLRLKELWDKEGRPILVEEYDGRGRLTVSRQDERGTAGRPDLAWYYDGSGDAIRAEKDEDGDGKVDTWFFYKDGRIERVEEDRNRDGRPDLWEVYDRTEAVVSRKEDLDFDGVADIERGRP